MAFIELISHNIYKVYLFAKATTMFQGMHGLTYLGLSIGISTFETESLWK